MPPEATASWLRVDSRGRPIGVDRKNQVIHGYIVAQQGPFKSAGRGEFDKTSLRQIRELMTQAPNGLKSRFAHPDLSGDGIGNYLGRARNPRYDTIGVRDSEGELKTDEIRVVRADLHLDPTSRDTPSGDLGGYVMDLAESDSDALSSSLVVQKTEELQLDSRGRPKRDADGNELPSLWRLTKLHASDIVDNGDAVDGLLSVDSLPDAALHRGAEILDNLFEGQSHDEIKETLTAYVGRYLDRRFEDGEESNKDDIYRRLARMLITPELIATLGSGTYHVIEHGHPADMRVVRTHYNLEHDRIEIVLQSAEFAPLTPGDDIPILRAPLIERVDDEPPEPPRVYDPSRDLELRRRRRHHRGTA